MSLGNWLINCVNCACQLRMNHFMNDLVLFSLEWQKWFTQVNKSCNLLLHFFSIAVAKSPAEIRIEPIIYQMFFFKRIEANFFLFCNIYSKSVSSRKVINCTSLEVLGEFTVNDKTKLLIVHLLMEVTEASHYGIRILFKSAFIIFILLYFMKLKTISCNTVAKK